MVKPCILPILVQLDYVIVSLNLVKPSKIYDSRLDSSINPSNARSNIELIFIDCFLKSTIPKNKN